MRPPAGRPGGITRRHLVGLQPGLRQFELSVRIIRDPLERFGIARPKLPDLGGRQPRIDLFDKALLPGVGERLHLAALGLPQDSHQLGCRGLKVAAIGMVLSHAILDLEAALADAGPGSTCGTSSVIGPGGCDGSRRARSMSPA